ncbi:hypothetical protein NX722_08830 [Endozoicomonas gorgoniicola]|uniref:Uncharacterized protein n=1 Tax=Endozoicomonas gorgoniicola TaxID=1234144 RepID=A0ABT3MTQ9_9GAMM|nr:hypothetical protein [Endozoicomonas gorgoniicola]MCW7552743.1 hypothetical protein [Endozoicomonas gorgoniicola]
MNLFSKHKIWWWALLSISFFIGYLTKGELGFFGAAGATFAFMFLPLILALIYFLISKFSKKEINSFPWMVMVTVIILLLALSKIATSRASISSANFTFSPQGCSYSVTFPQKFKEYKINKPDATGNIFPLYGAQIESNDSKYLLRAECTVMVTAQN